MSNSSARGILTERMIHRLTLDTRLFPKVRRYGIDNNVCSYQTCSSFLKAIDTTEPGTKIAISQMRVSLRALLCFLNGFQELVAWQVIIEQELWWGRSMSDSRRLTQASSSED